ncbi:MAG: GntR family transcriptional regulator [Acidimicrobiia bacterium]|nr:GntR family transcriptional regulator [Acidimicrobiia bacterium]MDH4307256.1 GntR family transcriptional regulator [Acidimicrobiia bacterium]MDH5292383.1 GntR family transcriptional regulator [Acidimicrobiia bacterium]
MVVSLNPKGTLAEQAYAAIKEAIINLDLGPGDAIVEDELAAQLGISKTPVRQALAQLEHEGLVVRIPYRATYVAEIDPADARDLIELRSVLEAVATRSAMTGLSDEDFVEAEDLLDRYDTAVERNRLREAHELAERFHDLILGRNSNRHVVPLLESLNAQVRRLRALGGEHADRARRTGIEHRAILEAIRAGDGEGVERAVRTHHHAFVGHIEDGRVDREAVS